MREALKKAPTRGCCRLSVVLPVLLFMTITACSSVRAHESPRFRTLMIADGLSQSSVYNCYQDSHGFMWFSTEDGLNRYDGYDFRIFRNEPGNPNSISFSYVSAVHEDSGGRLWIGTVGQGLNSYDYMTCRFTRFRADAEDSTSISGNNIFAICAGDECLWIGTDNGLDRYCLKTDTFRRYSWPELVDREGCNVIRAVIPRGDGRFWLGTGGVGLALFSPEDGTVERFVPPSVVDGDESRQIINVLFPLDDGRLFVGTKQGLLFFDPEALEFSAGPTVRREGFDLAEVTVHAVEQDLRGTVWIGTSEGLVRFDSSLQHSTLILPNSFEPTSLPDREVYSLFEDRFHVLWIGTHTGLARLDLKSKPFASYGSRIHGPGDMNSSQVRAFLEDDEGRIWIGTYDGLERWNRERSTFTHFNLRSESSRSLGSERVFSLAHDATGAMWIASNEGAFRLNANGESFTPLNELLAEERSFQPRTVRVVICDRRGDLWLGTTEGLDRLKVPGGLIARYHHDAENPRQGLTNDFVYSLMEARDGSIWIGTASGLSVLNPDSGVFTNYYYVEDDPHSLSSIEALALFEDSRGTIWIGTAGGLNRFHRDTGTFTFLTDRDGLPNNTIYGITEDDSGSLWLSTNRGLCRFDPRNGSMRNFDHWDGLPSDEFNLGACYHTRAGEVLFGGVRGYVLFVPGEIRDNEIIPELVFTEFKLANHPVEAGPDSPLPANIATAPEITLSHRDKLFSIEFSALHYAIPERNRYAYQLEGVDEDWVEIGNRRFVSYTSLAPGDYVFRVRGSNCDGVWNEEGISLPLRITPPVWQTAWFRLLAILAVAGLGVGIFRLRTAAIRSRNLVLESMVGERTEELELANEAKSEFLATMSHEIRTPLNFIIGITDLMNEREKDSSQKQYLGLVRESGQNLLVLINDILDLSKIEAGCLLLEPVECDLKAICEEAMAPIELMANAKNLDLKFHCQTDVPCLVIADRTRLRQVLINLLNNALKFTGSGSIVLNLELRELKEQRGDFFFRVVDTGIGIDPTEIDRLFDKFTQADASTTRKYGGTGLGLAISREIVEAMGGKLVAESGPGQGATFSFHLNLPLAKPDTEDIKNSAAGQTKIGSVEDLTDDIELGLNVLLVEDNPFNQMVAGLQLERIGCVVSKASDGREAVVFARQERFDAILMDCQMPEMDGFEATGKIRSAEAVGAHVPIIALTAQAMAGDRQRCIDAGMDDYLTKPVDTVILAQLLQSIRDGSWKSGATLV